MGLKIRAFMGIAGLALSWGFGLNFLSGIATYLDTTGNVMVDIADGIGLVSQGIEALEGYIDPSTSSAVDDKGTKTASDSAGESGIDAKLPVEGQSQPPTTPLAEPQKPVICKKGKCAPYDPTKDRVLQEQLIRAERQRILHEYASGSLPVDTVISQDLLDDTDEDLDEDDIDDVRRLRAAQAAIQKTRQQDRSQGSFKQSSKRSGSSNGRNSPPPTTTSTRNAPVTATPVTGKTQGRNRSVKKEGKQVVEPVILDPANPILPITTEETSTSEATIGDTTIEGSGSLKRGTKKFLGSLSGMFQKLNTLLLKVVAKIFPWNRRARRRLHGDSAEDDEL